MSKVVTDAHTHTQQTDTGSISHTIRLAHLESLRSASKYHREFYHKSNRKAMNRNWSNQKANPALKTKTGNKYILQIDKIQ